MVERALSSLSRGRSFDSVFLREAMRDASGDQLVERWLRIRAAWLRLRSKEYWGEERLIAPHRLDALRMPAVLRACQAATVAAVPCQAVIALLVRDGSDESFDALVAEFSRAEAAQNVPALKMLARQGRYARDSRHWTDFSELLKGALAEVTQKRGRTSYAHRLGLRAPLLNLSFHVSALAPSRLFAIVVVSDENRKLFANYGQGGVSVDEADNKVKDVRQLATWLQGLVRSRRAKWNWAATRIRTNLRGRERAAVLAWLKAGLSPLNLR